MNNLNDRTMDVSPTLLVLGLPWLIETGDFLSRGDNNIMVLVHALHLQFEQARAGNNGDNN